ncbi:hypothetical protein [Dyadobacter bucti]|uniref:hypothetical protein n=1 Tax=Dyadobacter bucti TaxID=2572203 RepID=UPI001109DBA0|nr:hypothetical protein [Dyadobacter bucti]
MSFITTYCHLTKDYCSVNGTIAGRRDPESADSWFKQIYKEKEFVYPKFYKMDILSQAGFLASELIKRANPELVTRYKDDEVAMLFGNDNSSAETDVRFRKSYQENGAPSPSLFVYTLPNIVMGEIAIINKWYGENMFAVLPKFVSGFFVDYAQILLATGSKAVLCGWLGIKDKSTEVFLFLIEKQAAVGIPSNADNLSALAGNTSFTTD